jgi:YidC/Oxa1 family membrane protein insertase
VGQILQPIGELFHALFYGPVFNVLMLIYHFTNGLWHGGAFAISIVLLTLIIRASLIPLTRKQLKSSRAMQVLQPQLAALKAQYKDNPQGMMAAQQALYKEHGVSPVSGCLPLVIQMPFLYALFFSFNTVLLAQGAESVGHHLTRINADIYSFLPKITELPATQFFWANLAQPDPLKILPLLAAILTLIQLRMAMPLRKKPAPGQPSDPTSQATQATQYLMPVMTFVFGLNFAAGLALYWCISTGFSAVQQYFLNGWGSLFLGIPKEWMVKLHMEHLIPVPPETASPALAGRGMGVASARGLVAAPTSAPPAPAESGGIRGLLRQLRDQMAAAQEQRATQNGTVVDATPPNGSESSKGQAFAVTPTVGGGNGAGTPRERRPRPSRTGPVLVKPAQDGAARERAELPERAIAREATDKPSSDRVELPEVALRRDAAGAPAVRNGTSNGIANGTGNGTAGTTRRIASQGGPRPSVSQQRKGTPKGGAGSGSARGRSGRPKGGR